MKNFAQKWTVAILDFLFPQSQKEKELNSLTTEGFIVRAERKIDNSDLESEQIFPIFDYKDELVRTAVWALKYHKNNHVAKILGEIMQDEILATVSDLATWSNFTEPILIPIPISKERLRERGYNQCELLAKNILANSDGFLTLDEKVLRKIKDTGSQTSRKNKKERIENLKGCFAVGHPEKIKNKNIILLDDVVTTGSTLREARKALLKSGARKVIAIVVAH